MFESRQFKNQFAIDLNYCFENNVDGVYDTVRRFNQYLLTLQSRIEEDNKRIREEIRNESEDVALSMLNDESTQNQLYFFSDMLLQSTVVAIYSYLDIKLAELATICAKHSTKKCSINWYKYNKKKETISDIEKHHAFLQNEIIPELVGSDELFQQLLKWKNLRLFLVHKNEKKFKDKDSDFFRSIKVSKSGISFSSNDDILDFLKLVDDYLNAIVNYTNEKYDLVEYQIIESN